MIFLCICVLAMLVFSSRYLFLEPKLPLRIHPNLQRMLRFSAPAVLTAISAPIVFTPFENQLWLGFDSPYIWSASAAVLLSLTSKNVLLSTLLSVVLFFVLKWYVFV